MSRLRHARGPARPQYTDSQGADRAVMMVMALSAEVAALRDRLDTHEQLGARGTLATPAAIEAYEASIEVAREREARNHAMIDRITRVLLEDVTPGRTPPDGLQQC